MPNLKLREVNADKELIGEFNIINKDHRVTCITFCYTILFISRENTNSKECHNNYYYLSEFNCRNIIKNLTQLIKENLSTINKLTIITGNKLPSEYEEFYKNLLNNQDIETYFKFNNEILKKINNNEKSPSLKPIVVSSTPQVLTQASKIHL